MNTKQLIKHGLLLLLTLFSVWESVEAQRQRQQNRPYADYRYFHLGFHVGMHVQDLMVYNSGDTFTPPESSMLPPLYAEAPIYAPGFSVGLVLDYSPWINWDIRLEPTLHLSERTLAFSSGGQEVERLSSRSNLIEVPLLLKYASVRLNNIRPYMVGGAYAALQIGQKKGGELRYKPLEYGVKVGVGCDFYLPYFKLCPELSFSYGLGDVVEHYRPDINQDIRYRYTTALSAAYARMIMLTFHFE